MGLCNGEEEEDNNNHSTHKEQNMHNRHRKQEAMTCCHTDLCRLGPDGVPVLC